MYTANHQVQMVQEYSDRGARTKSRLLMAELGESS